VETKSVKSTNSTNAKKTVFGVAMELVRMMKLDPAMKIVNGVAMDIVSQMKTATLVQKIVVYAQTYPIVEMASVTKENVALVVYKIVK
jgi:hypothetical protein